MRPCRFAGPWVDGADRRPPTGLEHQDGSPYTTPLP